VLVVLEHVSSAVEHVLSQLMNIIRTCWVDTLEDRGEVLHDSLQFLSRKRIRIRTLDNLSIMYC
jgi:hypothetical protein